MKIEYQSNPKNTDEFCLWFRLRGIYGLDCNNIHFTSQYNVNDALLDNFGGGSQSTRGPVNYAVDTMVQNVCVSLTI